MPCFPKKRQPRSREGEDRRPRVHGPDVPAACDSALFLSCPPIGPYPFGKEANTLRRKDLLIIGILAAAALTLVLIPSLSKQRKKATGGNLLLSPAGAAVTVEGTASADAAKSAQAWLSVQIGGTAYDPIPLIGSSELEIVQPDGKRNLVSYTPRSIRMKESNCANQDCVHQGEVTLDNRDRRVLQEMIICLPNQVVLSLLSAEEAAAQRGGAEAAP